MNLRNSNCKYLAKICLIALFAGLFLNSDVKSQEFLHGYGADYHFYADEHLTEDFYGAVPAVHYNARFAFKEVGDAGTFTIGANPALGFNFSYNTAYGSNTGLMFHFPILLEYNWGLGAYQDAYEAGGYFVGIGGEYNFNNYFGGSTENLRHQIGPTFTAGFRFRTFTVGTIRVMYSPKLGNDRYQALRLSYEILIGE